MRARPSDSGPALELQGVAPNLGQLLWGMAAMQILYLVGRSILQPELRNLHWLMAALVLLAAISIQLAPSRPFELVGWLLSRSLLVSFVLLLLAGLVYAASRGAAFADEAAGFQVATLGAREGVDAMLSRWIQLPWVGTQHPPLVLVLQAWSLRIFGPQIFWNRCIGLAFGCGVLALTYILGRRWYGPEVASLAAALLVAIRMFFRSSASGNLDVPLAFFFALLLLATQKLDSGRARLWAALGGLALGLGLLTRYTMVLALPAILLGWVVSRQALRRLGDPRLWGALGLSLVVTVPWLMFLLKSGFLEGQVRRLSQHAAITTTHRVSGLHYTFDDLVVHFPATFGGHMLLLVGVGLWSLWRHRETWIAARFHLGVIAGWSVILIMTHAEPRYFIPLHPLLALAGAQAVAQYELAGRARIVALALSLTALSLLLVLLSGDPVR